MQKSISYDALTYIEEQLEANLRDSKKDLFMAQKYDEQQEIKNIEWDIKQLEDAIGEVKAYSAYVANYVV